MSNYKNLLSCKQDYFLTAFKRKKVKSYNTGERESSRDEEEMEQMHTSWDYIIVPLDIPGGAGGAAEVIC